MITLGRRELIEHEIFKDVCDERDEKILALLPFRYIFDIQQEKDKTVITKVLMEEADQNLADLNKILLTAYKSLIAVAPNTLNRLCLFYHPDILKLNEKVRKDLLKLILVYCLKTWCLLDSSDTKLNEDILKDYTSSGVSKTLNKQLDTILIETFSEQDVQEKDLQNKLTNTRTHIETILNQYSCLLNEEEKLLKELEFLKFRNNLNTDLIDFIKAYKDAKDVTIIVPNYLQKNIIASVGIATQQLYLKSIKFIIMFNTTIRYWDNEIWKRSKQNYLKQRPERAVKVIENIFTNRKYELVAYNTIRVDMNNNIQCSETLSDYQKGFKNLHLSQFKCFGEARMSLLENLQKQNYMIFIELLRECIQMINMGDTTVITQTLDHITNMVEHPTDYSDIPFVKQGERVLTAQELLKEMEEDEQTTEEEASNITE